MILIGTFDVLAALAHKIVITLSLAFIFFGPRNSPLFSPSNIYLRLGNSPKGILFHLNCTCSVDVNFRATSYFLPFRLVLFVHRLFLPLHTVL